MNNPAQTHGLTAIQAANYEPIQQNASATMNGSENKQLQMVKYVRDDI